MTLIRDELSYRRQINFQSLLHRAASRVEIIVTFLAVLELIKQYVVEVQQDSLFGDIVIAPGKTYLQEISSGGTNGGLAATDNWSSDKDSPQA